MRHRVKKHLRGSHDRQKNERRALAASVVLYERVQLTEARAKFIKPVVEKMITRGKKQGLNALRLLRRDLPINAVKKIMEVLGPRYKDRPGGYARIFHVGKFRNGTKKVILELVK